MFTTEAGGHPLNADSSVDANLERVRLLLAQSRLLESAAQGMAGTRPTKTVEVVASVVRGDCCTSKTDPAPPLHPAPSPSVASHATQQACASSRMGRI